MSGLEILLLATIFLTVVAAVVGTTGIVTRDAFGRRRMEEQLGGAEPDDEEPEPVVEEKVSLSESESNLVDRLINKGRLPSALQLIEPFQRRLTQSDPDQVSQTRQSLIEAGYYEQQAVDIFFSVRLILAIVFTVLAGGLTFLFPEDLSGSRAIITVISGTALGYYIPLGWLRFQIKKRREAFSHGLPDALDMILVGVQAGLSLPAALTHVVEEFGDVHPVVAEQFEVVMLEFQAGMSRTEALERMAQRLRAPEARTFAIMVAQAESLGTRLSDTLLVISDEMRVDRELRAEQKAAELPVRMSLPLVLLVFPCLFLVIMVPVVINILETFSIVGS